MMRPQILRLCHRMAAASPANQVLFTRSVNPFHTSAFPLLADRPNPDARSKISWDPRVPVTLRMDDSTELDVPLRTLQVLIISSYCCRAKNV